MTIGALHLTQVDTATFEGFRQGLHDLGYVEGGNIRYHYLGAVGTPERLEAAVAELVAARPDLIFVSSTPATLAVQRATVKRPIPVVFAPVNDPVGAGIVASQQAPGANLTGIRLPQGDALRMQWLLRVAPEVRSVMVPYSPNDRSALESLHQADEASARLGIRLIAVPAADVDTLLADLRRGKPRADAIYLPRDSVVESRIGEFVALARAQRLPLCAPSLTQVEAGALVSYGFIHREIGRQAAHLADQILRGVPPADLPIETAGSFLAINLAAARAIGIRPADGVLRQAQVLIR